jgi:glycosyltransferase involved in cell wall biosynthesis
VDISVVIPVLGEEAFIADALQRLERAASEEPVEIIVVDGDPAGETLKSMAGSHARGIVGAKGRGRQMNEGAMAAKGDILLFLHVDTELPAGGFGRIRSAIEGRNFVAGAFDLQIDDRRIPFRIIERVASFRSRLTAIPYGDQAIFFDRDYFFRLGGYKELPIMEDVDPPLAKRRDSTVYASQLAHHGALPARCNPGTTVKAISR